MLPKPAHLGPQYAAQFEDVSVAAAYKFRPHHPPEAFTILRDLVHGTTRRVLDVGCGTGFIARGLAPLVDHLDALDPSLAMIETGKNLLGGDHRSLHWIHGRAEDAMLDPPYGLITAGDSLHWMDWEIVMPRFRQLLAPGAFLAIVTVDAPPRRPFAANAPNIGQYSTNQEFQPFDLLDELSKRDMFEVDGTARTAPIVFTQSLDDFVESFHARNGLSRQRMPKESATEFDAAIREWVLKSHPQGEIIFNVSAQITWGVPSGARR